MNHKLKCVKHKLKQWQSAYSKSCNPQCGPAQRYGQVGGSRPKSGLFNRYVIVGISEVFGHNHADLQSVTPALAHDCSANNSTAPRPKRRGFKLEKNSRKGCDRLEKKTSWIHFFLGTLVLWTEQIVHSSAKSAKKNDFENDFYLCVFEHCSVLWWTLRHLRSRSTYCTYCPFCTFLNYKCTKQNENIELCTSVNLKSWYYCLERFGHFFFQKKLNCSFNYHTK